MEAVGVESSDDLAGGIREIVSLREENVKHFKMTDGTYRAVSYTTPVHRVNSDGDWVDIDNRLSLQRKNNVSLYSTADSRVTFAENIASDSPLVSLTENGYGISMRFMPTKNSMQENADDNVSLVSPIVENSAERNEAQIWDSFEEAAKVDNKVTIRYEKVQGDVDLEYVLKGNDIKENIVVKAPQSSYSFIFTVSTVGLTAFLNENGEVEFVDSTTGVLRYLIPAPFMYDGNGEYSDAVSYELIEKSGVYLLGVIADSEWINEDDRVFPVTIDPSIIDSNSGIQDTYIYSSNAATNYCTSQDLWVSSGRITFVKIPTPALPSGATVNYAMLHMSYYYWIETGSLTAGAYQILQNFPYNTVTWTSASAYTNKGISTAPLSTAALAASSSITGTTPGKAQFEITDAVNAWYANSTTNYGIAIQYVSGTNASVILKSSESGASYAPYLSVAYTYYLPDGVYAFRNAYSATRFMTVEKQTLNPGVALQQKAFTESHPASAFDRFGLFKISRKPNTDYYIIRSMLNNNHSITVSGTSVITKTIASNDADVPLTDAFRIIWVGEGFYIQHAASTKILNMVSTTTANLNAIAQSSATSKSVWYPLEYSGVQKSGVLMYGTGTLMPGYTVTYSPVAWSTVINANKVYMYVDPSVETMLTSSWSEADGKLTLNLHDDGSFVQRVRILDAATSVVKHSFAGTVNVTLPFEEGTYFIKSANTGKYLGVNGDSLSNGAVIKQKPLIESTSLQWTIEHFIDGWYSIKSNYTGKYMQVSSSSVNQYSSLSNYSKWKFTEREGGGYSLYTQSSTGNALRTSSNDSVVYLAYDTALTDRSQEWYLNKASDYGCREYWSLSADNDIDGICKKTNCFGYAMNSTTTINPYFAINISGFLTTKKTIDEVADEVSIEFQQVIDSYKTKGDILDWTPITAETPIEETQYRIVFKVGRGEDSDGDGFYDDFDFHFWYQTSSGRWAHKNGTLSSQLLPAGVTPESTNSDGWALDGDPTYYDSKPFYYAITLPKEDVS